MDELRVTSCTVLGVRFCRFGCCPHCFRPRLNVDLHRPINTFAESFETSSFKFVNTSRCAHDSRSEEYSSCDLSDRLMVLALSHKTLSLPDHSSPSSLPLAEGRQYDSSQQKEGNG